MIVKVFEDLDYVVRVIPHSHYVEYEVYKLVGTMDDGGFVLQKGRDFVYTVDEADIYLHGHVKWDGCSNWYFDEQDRIMLHGCSKECLKNIGKIMAECWSLTEKYCETFDPC